MHYGSVLRDNHKSPYRSGDDIQFDRAHLNREITPVIRAMIGGTNEFWKPELKLPIWKVLHFSGRNEEQNQRRVSIPVLTKFQRPSVEEKFHVPQNVLCHRIGDIYLSFVGSFTQRRHPYRTDLIRTSPTAVMLHVIPVIAFDFLPHIDYDVGNVV